MKDVTLLRKLMRMSEPQMEIFLAKLLMNSYGYKVRSKFGNYLFAEGDGSCPICLLAHMDTVFKAPPEDIFYDPVVGVMWSPDGMGADDRAGIFAILRIIEAGFRPHIILTNYEEVGMLGASNLIEDYPMIPEHMSMKYLIQLDRRGAKDCVFYDCENEDFEKYINSFGFKSEWGTCSDISVIAPHWGIAAVNLSIGYYNEHSKQEILRIRELNATIGKIKRMLTRAMENPDMEEFIYIPRPIVYNPYPYSYPTEEDFLMWDGSVMNKMNDDRQIEGHCVFCGARVKNNINGIMMKDKADKTHNYMVCDTCLENKYAF